MIVRSVFSDRHQPNDSPFRLLVSSRSHRLRCAQPRASFQRTFSGRVQQPDKERINDLGSLILVCRINHVVLDPHRLWKVDRGEPLPRLKPINSHATESLTASSLLEVTITTSCTLGARSTAPAKVATLRRKSWPRAAEEKPG